MSILNKFNTEKASNAYQVNWIPLEKIDTITASIIPDSFRKPVVIFKHSTRCGVSRMVLKQFETEYKVDDKLDLYFLDLLKYREVSNEIAAQFRVEHQSPQVLVIKDGISVYDASHSGIDTAYLEKYVP